MFQTDAIFPWKTVLQNVCTGPLYRGVPRHVAQRQAHEWISRVGLAGFEDRYPNQLGGGMRNGVAFARTLINKPPVLLRTEPFASLDVQTRPLRVNGVLGF